MIAFQKRLSKNLQKSYTDSPDIEAVRKLAKGLDMSIGELLKEEDEYECKY